jgi:hypothetical protein
MTKKKNPNLKSKMLLVPSITERDTQPLSYSSGGTKYILGVTGGKVRCQQASFLSRGSKGKFISFFMQVVGRILFLVAPVVLFSLWWSAEVPSQVLEVTHIA